ncbi:pyruvate kinase [Candidatus Woesearchaeota archaeon]|nr:MAG: pyruvate kinase [Candidatus Woesearchaeota archaeon]
MKKTKIIATLGPASSSKEMIKQLHEAGVDIVRLNMSHGDHDFARSIIENVRAVSKNIAILLDTKGPEIRTKDVLEPVTFNEGALVTLTYGSQYCTQDTIYITYQNLPNEVQVGTTIILDDGAIELRVEEVRPDSLLCSVIEGGILKGKKTLNVPNVNIKLPSVSQEDFDDISFAIEQEVDFIAASFIRSQEDVLAIRKLLEEKQSKIQIISKIESRQGVENLTEIIEVSDGIMVARGDLGVEMRAEEVPIIQKKIVEACNLHAKPVIVATQMLESMITAPRPTRAETSDVANAILDGTDAIMLSAESAVGKYPLKAVQTMVRIAEYIEQEREEYQNKLFHRSSSRITDAICRSSFYMARDLHADFIVAPTMSGYTARNLAKFRPPVHILATTPDERCARQLNLLYGVVPIVSEHKGDRRSFIDNSVGELVDRGYLKPEHLIIITAGMHVGKSGSTNLLEVHKVGELLQTNKD